MATVTSKDGTTIAYDRTGAGPTIIIVSGALSYRNLWDSDPFDNRAGQRLQRLTYDRRGRGESGDTQPYAVAREIEDLEALIDATGGSAYLYGVSSGAALSLLAREKLGPTKVSKIALYEPPYDTTEEGKQRFAQYIKQNQELIAAGRNGDAVELFLADIVPPEQIAQMRASPAWPLLERIAPTIAYDSAILGNGAVRHRSPRQSQCRLYCCPAKKPRTTPGQRPTRWRRQCPTPSVAFSPARRTRLRPTSSSRY
jgi:pimeloyl-ACP methyl ester carboxylesterase